MYVAMRNHRPIAFHKDMDVINLYVMQLDEANIEISHIPKKKAKSFEVYSDLYLVRYGDGYIPRSLYDVARHKEMDDTYGYKTAIDVLYRLVEEGDVCGKETNHVAKTIAILERILDETTDLHVDDSSIQMLTDAKDLEDMYNSIIGK